MISDFHFMRPLWLLALPVIGLLVWLAWRKIFLGSRWRSVIDPGLLPWMIEEQSSTDWKRVYLLLLFAWLAAVIALAGPTWEKLPSPVQRKIDMQIVLLDLSMSMYAQDIKPSRLERARYKLQDFLQRRKEGQTALIAYAGDAFVVTPFTDDTATIVNQVRALEPTLMPAPGSNLQAALKQAETLLAGQTEQNMRVLLITDEVRASELSPASRWFDKHGIPLDILAVGTASGAPIPLPGGDFARNAVGKLVTPAVNIADLRTLARSSGGQFQLLRADNADLQKLLGVSDSWNNAGERAEGTSADTWKDAGVWLTLLILPFAAFAFRRGYLVLLPAALLLAQPEPAQAFDWNDLWLNRDQAALEQFEAEQYEQASEKFTNPEWQASALYRAGKHAEAAEKLAPLGSARAQYNRGNALAQSGDLQSALEAYDHALSLQPEHADALANRRIVEELLRQQEQQDQQPGDDQSGEDGKPSEQQGNNGESGENSTGQPESGEQPDAGNAQSEEEQSPEPQEEQAGAQEEASPEQDDDKAAEQREADSQSEQGENESSAATSAQDSQPSAEEQQALDQWLRRIPDDPSALLRRKFQWQYQQRGVDRRPTEEEQYW